MVSYVSTVSQCPVCAHARVRVLSITLDTLDTLDLMRWCKGFLFL